KIREHGYSCSAREIFQHPTLVALAPALNRAAMPADDGDGFDARLTPIEAWFFDLELSNRHHWNQAVVLELAAGLAPAVVAAAIEAQVRRHAAFFWSWRQDGAGWSVAQDHAAPRHLWLALPGAADDAQAAQLAQQRIHLSDGALSVCVHIDARPARLVWLVHHLAVDAVSWHVLLGDVAAALDGAAVGQARLASSRQRRVRDSAGFDRQQLALWSQTAQQARPSLFDAAGACTYGDQRRRDLLVGGALWRQLQDALRHGLRLDELLLAALAPALAGLAGQSAIALALEHHGRDLDERGAQAGAEVGWFTAIAPIVVSAPPEAEPLDWLANTVEALALWTPRAAEWLGARPALAPQDRALPAISFNYLGNFAAPSEGGALKVLPLPALALHDPDGRRPFAHDLIAWSDAGGLHLQWLYDGAHHDPAVVDNWLAAIVARLELLAGALDRSGPRLPALALQEGLVYHAANDDSDRLPSYLGQVRGTLSGALDAARFEAAWIALTRRHAALRTRFYWQADGRVRQQIETAVRIPLRQVDLRGLDAASAGQVLRQELAAQHRKPFALDKAPLMRLLLARLDEQRWAFGWTHHHAIVDGWSLPVLLTDLLALYDAQQNLPLPAACTPAELARYRLSRDSRTASAAWRELLAPLASPSRLASGAAGPAADADLDLTLAQPLGDALGALAASHGLTLNSLFQTAWTLTVAAFSDTLVPCFGVTVAGRDAPLAGIEQLVGLAINTLPMVVALDPAEPLIALARRVQSTLVRMQAHAETPLPALQRLAGHAGHELFDTLYVFENYPRGALSGRTLTVSDIEMAERAHYPVTLAVLPGPAIGLRLALRGAGSATALGAALLARLQATLQALAATPQLPAGALHAALPACAAGAAAVPAAAGGASFSEIFERSAAATPDAIAIACGDVQWRYGELDAMAERVAGALQQRGIGPETLVALCARRTPETMACLLGVAKAGAAFLPLDADTPAARLRATLDRAAPALVIAETELGAALTGLALATPAALLAAGAGPRTRQAASLDALAYVIYTSGSTGTPKGVEVSQRGLHNLMQAQQRACRIDPAARVYQFASLGFDAAVSELLMAFGAGATLCLPEQGRGVVDIDFEADLRRHRPTHITLPPSLLASLAPAALDSVHTLLVAGERSGAAQLQPWRAPGRLLINAYGPTEASVCASMEAWDGAGDPLLGRPMAGVTMHLLDSWMRPVEAGVIGELYLGGAGLARGYRALPGLTAAAFVPDPFSDRPGQRLYRSGDLARRLADGRLVYAGRRDEQIKLRGQRIEPGEVEAVLASLPGVRRVRVAAWNGDGALRLAAWIEDGDGRADLAQLAQLAARQLTPAMVPSLWAAVPDWPLNASGKVDARLLPVPAPLAGGGAADAPLEAGGAVFDAVCAAWAEALGLAAVAASDDFYAIGGDSILAMRISSRLRAEGYVLQPRDILEAVTPLELARRLAAPPAQAQHPAAPLLEAPLAPAQRWFLDLAGGQPRRFLLSAELQLAPGFDRARLLAALRQAMEGYPVLRARLAPELDRQWLDPHAAVPVLCSAAGQPRAQFMGAARAVIDPLQGPAFVCALYLGDGDGGAASLLLAGHHLWLDVISLQHLAAAIERAYQGAPARPAATTFLHWSEQLARLAGAGAFDAEAGYWRGVLAPAGLHLLASARPDYASVGREQWSLPLAPDATPPLAMLEALLLQALGNVLAGAGRPELLVECERHGRDPVAGQAAALDVSDATGWFTAAFPVRVRSGDTVAALARRLAQLPHGGIGFGALRDHRRALLGADFAALYGACRVGFNFLGRIRAGQQHGQSLFDAIGASDPLHDIAPELALPHPLTVEAWLDGDGLSVRWSGQRGGAAPELAAAHRREVQRLLDGGAASVSAATVGAELPAPDEMQALLAQLRWAD
ncbi:non-ribosomal peptide synthetase, partial [Janthinobacterium agaricidamnosum]